MTEYNQKYYKLAFPRNCSTDFITLMEYKKLEVGEYHPYKSSDYFPVVVFRKRTEFIQESPLVGKKDYTIYQKEVDDRYFKRTNNRDYDDFLYDAKKGIVVYGNVYIYLVKKDGHFYDVVTGEEVPCHSFFRTIELRYCQEYDDMIKHLTLISQHKELYQKTVSTIFMKYKEEYLNYINAQNAYRLEVEKVLESFESELEEPEEFENTNLRTKKEKIKTIVNNFNK